MRGRSVAFWLAAAIPGSVRTLVAVDAAHCYPSTSQVRSYHSTRYFVVLAAFCQAAMAGFAQATPPSIFFSRTGDAA